MSQPSIAVPEVDGRRSTSALGRAVVADALRAVDPSGAGAAAAETDWRRRYLTHFRRLVVAGLGSREAALTVARDGLAGLHTRMVAPGAVSGPTGRPPLGTATVAGTGPVERHLVIPYRGRLLRDGDLARQLERWVAGGIIEPSCAEAVRTVAANPDWLDLSDRRLVVLGAGAEMGPLEPVLRWGGDVLAVDLPRPEIWARLRATAAGSGGRLTVPTDGGTDGVDLLADLARVGTWLADLDGPLVLGNYVYADGAAHLLASMAVDALTLFLLDRRPDDLALAFLATPTDVFAVPPEAAAAAGRQFAARRLAGPARMLSGGRLFARNYPDAGADPAVTDSLVPQQGPNYALAKRLQRWRAAVARAAGTTVSLRVAPATRTRSVTRQRLLAAAYAGAHRFGVEVFEPATSNTLMAALLVHDLRAAPPARPHPWQDEAYAAAHGGLWRAPYAARSALGVAVLFGLGRGRN